MRYIFCEGPYDAYWLDELNRQLSYVPYIVGKNMSELIEIIGKRGIYYDFLTQGSNTVIYKDHGRKYTIHSVPSEILRSSFATTDEFKYSFILVVDSDGTDLQHLLRTVREKILVRNLKDIDIIIMNDNIIEITSTIDSRYKTTFLLAVLPNSLERLIVEKALVKRLITRCQTRNPHDQLSEISEKCDISNEELIRKSIRENWFENDDWFHLLIRNLTLN